MKATRFTGGLAVAALSFGLGACGSSSDSSSTATKTLSRSALIAKVNSICDTAQAAAGNIPAPASYEDPVAAAAYFDKIAPITRSETDDLRALKPASDVKADYARFISAQQQATALLETLKRKAHAQDPSGMADLQKVQGAGQQVADAATKLGATACAQ